MFKLHYRLVKLILIAVTTSLIIVSCNEIDGYINGNSNNADSQQKEIDEVVEIQNNAGTLIENLFSSGADTVMVKDSLASFFLNDNSVKNVWINSQGIAVEYENGIRGGVFLSPANNEKGIGGLMDSSILGKNGKNSSKEIVPLVSPPEALFIGAGNAEFQEDITIVQSSNPNLEKINVSQFNTKYDTDAGLMEYKNLSNYGIVHLSGHGYAWPVDPDKPDFKEVYLLTGLEVSNTDIITNKYTLDQAKEDMLVVLYSYKKGTNKYKKSRIWISPKFISDNNKFTEDSTSVYGSFCYSFCGGWPGEMVNSAKAEIYVGYDWSISASIDATFVNYYYSWVCDISKAEAQSAGDWYDKLVSVGLNSYINSKNHKVGIKYEGNSAFKFWKEGEILEYSKARIAYGLIWKYDNYCPPATGIPDPVWSDHGASHDLIDLTLNKSGNAYSGSWISHTSYYPGYILTGSITFSLRDNEHTWSPDGQVQTNVATSVEYEIKWEPDAQLAPAMAFGWEITMTDVEFKMFQNGRREFWARGMETCNKVLFKYYETCSPYENGDLRRMSSFDCNENTYVCVSVGN
ncbi:hypothetical protein ACFLSY_11050 [Bacteroidota bacterium]